MVKKVHGFSLIELMIAVAVVGVLFASVIPLYQGYTLKSQVGRAVGELAHYKGAFEAQLAQSATVTNADIGYVGSNLTVEGASTDVAEHLGDGFGQLQVTLGGDAHPKLAGVIIRFLRNGSGDWQCEIDPIAATGWADDFSPSSCSVL